MSEVQDMSLDISSFTSALDRTPQASVLRVARNQRVEAQMVLRVCGFGPPGSTLHYGTMALKIDDTLPAGQWVLE